MEMMMIAEGAEANVYRCTFMNMPAIAKRRIRKQYRIESLDTYLRTHRTKIEAKIMMALAGKINLPRVLAVSSDTIYMDFIEGKRLSIMTDEKAIGRHVEESGHWLAVMHDNDITHGDFTPANIMANGNSAYVIDFGLSYFTGSIEDKAIDLLLMKRSISKELFSIFIHGYDSAAKDSKPAKKKLAEIELRGRYQLRSLATVKG